MKVLVLGATGMAGHMVSLYFKQRGHDVDLLSSREAVKLGELCGGKVFLLDVREANRLEKIVKEGDYDALINCVGILNTACEDDKALAVYVNSYLPHKLAFLTRHMPTKVVHMSTDCVFLGDKGAYGEQSVSDAKSFYGRSKALGELNDDKNLTLRTSIIGPDINKGGIGLLHWFVHQRGSIEGYTRCVWTGVSTLTLAKAMEKAIEEDLCGLYHLVNNTTITKYELCVLFNRYFRKGTLAVEKDESIRYDKSLVCTREDFSFQVPTYAQMVEELYDWVMAHPLLYGKYFE